MSSLLMNSRINFDNLFILLVQRTSVHNIAIDIATINLAEAACILVVFFGNFLLYLIKMFSLDWFYTFFLYKTAH